MNLFNEVEFQYICKKFNADNSAIKDVTIHYNSPNYYSSLKSVVQRDRRGEVVFCVIRPNGKIITVTCSEYPDNVYRIPTGGIGHREDILEAIFREVKEELGLEVRIRNFAGVVRICFEHENDNVMFYSYIFILDETGGRLLEDASDDEVSEVREAGLDDLERITKELGCISGKWQDWGIFRQVTTGAVLNFLRNKSI
ncbi:MAG TPA: NUDIX domain-containing protein [Clostridia bacterium]|nr:NUDIX domain-containing protein [Clostridia bacterium]